MLEGDPRVDTLFSRVNGVHQLSSDPSIFGYYDAGWFLSECPGVLSVELLEARRHTKRIKQMASTVFLDLSLLVG